MNSKITSLVKSKLRKYLKDKEVLDIVVFGSAIKGKALPNDIDIALITKKDIRENIPPFHISVLKPEDFFISPPSIVHTLLREGYSIKHKSTFSEKYKFSNRVIFCYELSSLRPSIKVKVVNILRGKGGERGLVKENNAQWLANQVFLAPVEKDYIFEKVFLNFGVKFKRFYALIG